MQQKVDRVCQLPPLQHGVLYESLRRAGSAKMIYQAHIELAGPIQPAVLRESWLATMRRHPALRNSFHYDKLDVPVQVTHRQAEPSWRVLDWRECTAETQQQRLADLLAEDRSTPFDLTKPPLLRLALIRVSENKSWLIWTLHPLLVDGWSFYLVLADVFQCYEDLAAGREPAPSTARPYWEYVSWLQRKDIDGAEQFWRDRLADLPEPLPLGDRVAAKTDAPHREIPVVVSPELAAKLLQLTRRCRVTLGTVVHAAWAIMLSRCTRRDDVTFGGIISGRDPSFDGVDEVVGVFMNNQPVRTRFHAAQSLPDWLTEFQKHLVDARQYAHVPLSTVQQCSGLPHDVPLLESIVDFCNYPLQDNWEDAGSVAVATVTLLESPPYPLALVGVGGDHGWRLIISYDPDKFTDTTASDMADLVTSILDAMATRPEQTVATLPQWTGAGMPAATSIADPVPTAEASPVDRATEPLLDLMAAVWRQALQLPATHALHPTCDFFDNGGTSLSAIRLISRVRSALDVDFTVTDLFADATLAGTTRAVEALLTGSRTANLREPIPRADRGLVAPPSFAQERLWFIDQLDEKASANNLVLTGRFAMDIDADAMRTALAGLITRHEALRTCLRARDGVVTQVIRADAELPMAFDDLSAMTLPAAVRQAQSMVEQDAAHRFDLASDIPIRARLIRLAPQDTVLGISIHHIAYDAWSGEVLINDLAELYEAAYAGKRPELPPLPIQYADFSTWQREQHTGERYQQLIGYWQEQLAGIPDELRLGSPRPQLERTGGADAVETILPPHTAEAVHRLCTAEAATPFMVCLAAFGVLLSRHIGHEDVVIGTPVDDRDHPDLEPLVGLFVNTQVLRLPLAGAVTFRDLLARVREVCIGALAHRGLPFGTLVKAVSPHRVADRMPLVQVSFVLHAGQARPMRLAGTTAAEFPVRQEVPRFELTAELYEAPDGLGCNFHFAEDVYRRDFVERLVEEYADLLQLLITEPDQQIRVTRQPDGASIELDSLAVLRSLSQR